MNLLVMQLLPRYVLIPVFSEVLARLMERPYIFEALVESFSVVWEEEVVRSK